MSAGTMRMGELLGRIARLSQHDVEEILSEQSATRRRFGELAVEMGMCQPKDVWTAWCAQLSISPQHVDLDETGIDTQALAFVPPAVARGYCVVPIRAVGAELILATTPDACARARAELPAVLKRDLKFVTTDPETLARYLEDYYPALSAAS